jgi:hypothetical protein
MTDLGKQLFPAGPWAALGLGEEPFTFWYHFPWQEDDPWLFEGTAGNFLINGDFFFRRKERWEAERAAHWKPVQRLTLLIAEKEGGPPLMWLEIDRIGSVEKARAVVIGYPAPGCFKMEEEGGASIFGAGRPQSI